MKDNKKQKVWVTVSETINTGNYNSVKLEAGYTETYDTQSPIDLINENMDELLKVIQKKAKQIRKKEKK